MRIVKDKREAAGISQRQLSMDMNLDMGAVGKVEDENDPASDNDFGKNIIPAMLADGLKMVAHRFDGYWKDVGTIQSLWEANMELLDDNPGCKLDDDDWRIYSKNPIKPPHYVSA